MHLHASQPADGGERFVVGAITGAEQGVADFPVVQHGAGLPVQQQPVAQRQLLDQHMQRDLTRLAAQGRRIKAGHAAAIVHQRWVGGGQLADALGHRHAQARRRLQQMVAQHAELQIQLGAGKAQLLGGHVVEPGFLRGLLGGFGRPAVGAQPVAVQRQDQQHAPGVVDHQLVKLGVARAGILGLAAHRALGGRRQVEVDGQQLQCAAGQQAAQVLQQRTAVERRVAVVGAAQALAIQLDQGQVTQRCAGVGGGVGRAVGRRRPTGNVADDGAQRQVHRQHQRRPGMDQAGDEQR